MKFGICCNPYTLGEDPRDVKLLLRALSTAGADYLEFGVAVTDADNDSTKIDELAEALEGGPLKIEAFNSFIPASHRITGPNVDLPKLLNYAGTALKRCKQIGGEVVVLGSGGARSVPEGFPMDQALAQFIEFGRELGPIAADAGITIAIEPLNSREDNLITSVAHGAEVMDQIAHPSIRLLADLYHIAEDKEPLSNTANAGARLAHTHVADKGRVAPGYAPDGEEDFIGFFRALRTAGYDTLGDNARCSFEGSFTDILTQSGALLSVMKNRWSESA